MKVRESGMPDQALWESYFDAEGILDALGFARVAGAVLEFGCGYGTFTLPAARRTSGTVYALDIDPAMTAATRERAAAAGIGNVVVLTRDFLAAGTGRPDGGAAYAMLFNILHHSDPVALLREAQRSLSSRGHAGVVHWVRDPATPRGPPMRMRPDAAQVTAWAAAAGFAVLDGPVALPPWHWGLRLQRSA